MKWDLKTFFVSIFFIKINISSLLPVKWKYFFFRKWILNQPVLQVDAQKKQRSIRQNVGNCHKNDRALRKVKIFRLSFSLRFQFFLLTNLARKRISRRSMSKLRERRYQFYLHANGVHNNPRRSSLKRSVIIHCDVGTARVSCVTGIYIMQRIHFLSLSFSFVLRICKFHCAIPDLISFILFTRWSWNRIHRFFLNLLPYFWFTLFRSKENSIYVNNRICDWFLP